MEVRGSNPDMGKILFRTGVDCFAQHNFWYKISAVFHFAQSFCPLRNWLMKKHECT